MDAESGNNTLENRELIQNQSEMFRVSLNFNKNTFGRLENKINELIQYSNNQTNQTNTMQLELNENTLIQYAQLLISKYYRVLGRVRRTLTNTRNGQLIELIPKRQLASDLRHIGNSLKSDQQIPN